MRAHASTLALIGARKPPRPAGRQLAGLVALGPGTVPFAAVDKLSRKLGLEGRRLLRIIGIPDRTAARRKKQGFLAPEEADRLLRVARVVEEAARIFGSAQKAARWLETAHPLLGDVPPRELLDSDAGAQLVRDELTRIDYGDFA